jgi:hypothetical protein
MLYSALHVASFGARILCRTAHFVHPDGPDVLSELDELLSHSKPFDATLHNRREVDATLCVIMFFHRSQIATRERDPR